MYHFVCPFLWFRPVLVQAEPHIDGKAYPCAGYFSDKTWLVVSEGGGPGFLMLSPNLWSKIFPFTKRSGLRIFPERGGGGVCTF